MGCENRDRVCKLAAIGIGAKIFSVESSIKYRKFYIAKSYLGLLMVSLWGIILILKICQERNISNIQTMKSPTISNFTLLFKNLPK